VGPIWRSQEDKGVVLGEPWFDLGERGRRDPPAAEARRGERLFSRESGYTKKQGGPRCELKERWIFPDDSRVWNAFGGITTVLDNGDLLIGGMFAIKRSTVGDFK
jgi:hypothetical protein